jgi:DNA-directed RNA polymerase specialized sigma24 family protein
MNQTTTDDTPSALTRQTRAGQPVRRPRGVEAQIKELLPLPAGVIDQRIKVTDSQASDFVCEEALVYLIRSNRQRGDLRIVNTLTEALLRRIGRRTHNMLSSLGRDRAAEAKSAVVEELFRRILDLTTDRGDFLQVRFWQAHKGIVIDVTRQQLREIQQVEEWPVEEEEGEDDNGDDESNSAGLLQSADVPIEEFLGEQEALEMAQQALNSVPEPYRTAYALIEIEGWPIEAQDPDTVTVSRHFGRTSRTIRNWHDKAQEFIKRWRRENP